VPSRGRHRREHEERIVQQKEEKEASALVRIFAIRRTVPRAFSSAQGFNRAIRLKVFRA
jgi:hypothetical protein